MKKQPKIPLATSGEKLNPKNMVTSDVLKLRRKLAKRLNQRMKRLEDKGLTNGGAYADYQDILNRYFDGAKRIPENEKIYKHLPRTEVQAIQKVLKEKTSTVQGWNEVMQKRVDTIEQRYGVRFKNNYHLYDFLKSAEFKMLAKLYGSKQALRLIEKSGFRISEVQKMMQSFLNRTDRTLANDIAVSLGFKNEKEALKYKGV